MAEVTLVSVRMDGRQPVVVLKEADGDRYLPIYIGAVEYEAIRMGLRGETFPRPLTHDLLLRVLEQTGDALAAVRITEFRDNVYFAELVLTSGRTVDTRPSDALALATRARVTVECSEDVLAEQGTSVADEQETELERFREFLDGINPEDFGADA